MRMPAPQFLLLDTAGAALYAGAYLTLGYLAGDLVKASLPMVQATGRVIEVVAGLGLAAFIGYRLWRARHRSVLKQVPRVSARDAAATADAAVFDVRSHGYYDSGAQRIKGATRMDPHSLAAALPELPPDTKIYLYCTCHGEATSLRVAHHLRELGFETFVIDGGLRSWQRAGLPVEPVPQDDIILLPDFRHPAKPRQT
jgi:rhodanese-related sulfurtransferase